jgi:hypothetical protein
MDVLFGSPYFDNQGSNNEESRLLNTHGQRAARG